MRKKRDSTFRRLSSAVLALLALSAMGTAQAVAQEGPPTFHIEKITVEAPRLSPEIVLSESLLVAGEDYTEAELSEAVHRINRLPFVLLAEFSLRKGSMRDRYELIVKVFEARRWFFQVGGDWELKDSVSRLDPRFDRVFGVIGNSVQDVRSLVGRRFALGRRGLLFASMGSEDGTFALGYQRYDLWDRNVLLNLSLGAEDQIGDVLFATDTFAARAQLGIPIRGNHALRVLAARSEFQRDFSFGGVIEQRETEAEIAWIFNSLDDPILPREGSVYEAGLSWLDTQDLQVFGSPDSLTRFESSFQSLGVSVSAGRHWPVAERQSLSASVRGFLGELPGGGERWETEASVGHQVFLLRRLELDKWRELRFETQLSALRQDFSVGAASAFVGLPDLVVTLTQARAGLVYRNGWGLFRFFYSYADRDFG